MRTQKRLHSTCMKIQRNGKRLKRQLGHEVNMNRELMRLLVSNNLNTTSKTWQSKFDEAKNWQKDCAKHEMISKVIIMCASSKIIYRRLEAVVEAN